jgi:hypothetical protein
MDKSPILILTYLLAKAILCSNKQLSAACFLILYGLIPASTLKAQTLATGQSSSSASYAITASGKLFSWGVNHNAQLGNFNYDHSATPIDISGNGALAGKTIVSVAAGTQHAVALDADGSVYVWGYALYLGGGGPPDLFHQAQCRKVTYLI